MAYKFQAGDATLSGSVTLVAYQDLLFESDGVSDIGTAASEVGVTYTTRLTASVGISGSAIFADNFYGNGSNLTGVSAVDTTVTGSSANTDLQLVLVQNVGTDVSLAADNAGAIAFNPSTNLLSSIGDIAAVDLSGSDVVAGKSVLLGQNGNIGATGHTDLITLSTNSVVVEGAISGALSISGKSVLLGQNGNIGAIGHTDLITLSTNSVVVEGAISGSTSLAGKSLVLGQNGVIGATGDTNLITLASNLVTVEGTISGSDALSGKSVLLGQNGVIGPVGDTDLIALSTNKVTVSGVLSGSGALQGPSLSLNAASIATDGDLAAVAGTFTGAISGSSTLSAAGAVQLDGADDGVAFVAADNLYFRDAGTGQMRRDSFSDVMEVAAGTVTDTGIENTSGVLSFALASLTEAAVATTDYVVFADATDSDSIKKEAVDDLMEIGMSLLSEVPMAIGSDFLVFSDATDSNKGARIKMKSFIAAAADGTSITSSNGVLSVIGAQNIDVDTVGNASFQLTSAGMNYATASISTNVTYTLPASPSTGDIVYIKLAGVTPGKHVVISGSSMQMIDGTSTITASSGYAGISLCYVASDIWRIF